MDDEIKKLADDIVVCYNEAYDIYEPKVQTIINNQVKDCNYIEQILDYTIDNYAEKGFNLFMKLLLYYQTVNPYNAREYYELLKNTREEEHNEYVKKLKK